MTPEPTRTTTDGGIDVGPGMARDANLTTHLAGLPGVVVGDDGSACSQEAVRWAARAAHAFGLPLHIVRAWRLLSSPRPESWAPGYAPPLRDWERAVKDELSTTWTPRLAEVTPFEVHAVHGEPVTALVEASRGAEMVVVGSRGHGPLFGMLLGSVAQGVARDARSPVVIVRN